MCSAHFINGKPAPLFEVSNPDWVPTLSMGYDLRIGNVERYNCAKRRRLTTSVCNVPESESPSASVTPCADSPTSQFTLDDYGHSDVSCQTDDNDQSDVSCQTDDYDHSDVSCQTDDYGHSDVSCQTELNKDIVDRLEKDNNSLRCEVAVLRSCNSVILSPELFQSNTDILTFYTELPSWTIFNAVMTLVSSCRMPNSKLNTFERIVMFLMKNTLKPI